MKKIRDLINYDSDIDICGVTDDSRSVSSNYLFVATKGYNVDHYDYIYDAIKRGAVFIVCDRKIDIDIPHIIVENIDDVYKEICLKYYDINLDDYSFIGITGTDGKTTTSTIISNIINNSAYLGTNGLSVNNKSYNTNNTTPCISELYNDLSIVKENRCSNIVMEVSSEALLHNRVNNFKYEIIGFTNITGDHLNVHKTFENYVECKMKLLDLLRENGKVVVNGDDEILRKIKRKELYTFGFNECNDYVIYDVKYLSNYTRIKIKNDDKDYILKTVLKGKYNVYNVVMAFIICLLYGLDSKYIIDKIYKIKSIDGRGELLKFGQDFDIVLDYAHTINGISCVLESYKNYNRIITVTGCAGGREKNKRSIIGKIVMDNSDISIFTMDDPRYESVDCIIDQMVGDRTDYIRIIDRSEAIKYALSIASSGDVVLILGKGRDNYMAIEDKKIEYSDYIEIKNFFS